MDAYLTYLEKEQDRVESRLTLITKFFDDAMVLSNDEYKERLEELLFAARDYQQDVLYKSIAESVFGHVRWHSRLKEEERLEVWMVYESCVNGLDGLPARVVGDQAVMDVLGVLYPIHGYHSTERTSWSTARFLLNLVLDSRGIVQQIRGQEESKPIIPASVHEWFVKAQPVANRRGVVTMTVSVSSDCDSHLGVKKERHASIFLPSYEDSREGLLWGPQLASALSKFETRTNEPFNWPYLEIDSSSFDPLTYFVKEWDNLQEGLSAAPSPGFLRSALYSALLFAIFRSPICDEAPPWLKNLGDVLKRTGFDKLATDLDRAFDDLRKRADKTPVRRMIWVAPTLSLTAANQRPTAGSLLLLSSAEIEEAALFGLPGILATAFVYLWSAEQGIKNEQYQRKYAELTAKLRGIDETFEGFGHEISRLVRALTRFVPRIDEPFQINSSTKPKSGAASWNQPVGVIHIDDAAVGLFQGWKVCCLPYVFDGLLDVLQTWASSSEWENALGLQKDLPLAEVVDKLVDIGLRAGVVARIGTQTYRPDSLAKLHSSINAFKGYDKKMKEALMPIDYRGAPLQWHGSNSEAKDAHSAFSRIVTAIIANAVKNIYVEYPWLLLSIFQTGSRVRVRLYNSCLPGDHLNETGDYGTKSVIQLNARYLTPVNSPPTFGSAPDEQPIFKRIEPSAVEGVAVPGEARSVWWTDITLFSPAASLRSRDEAIHWLTGKA